MLKYNGLGYYPGVPTRDLNDEEIEKYGGEKFLLALKIYEKVIEPVKKPVKEVSNDTGN